MTAKKTKLVTKSTKAEKLSTKQLMKLKGGAECSSSSGGQTWGPMSCDKINTAESGGGGAQLM